MGRNCKMAHNAEMIRDVLWVKIDGKDADALVFFLRYSRENGAKAYKLFVSAYDTAGWRFARHKASAEVWSVANRRSALSDSRAVSIARDYLRRLVRDVAVSCGADADKAVDDAVVLADKNW